MSGEVILIALVAGGLWFAGHETVKGVKKLDHAIVRKFHIHNPKPDPVKTQQ